MEIYHTSPNKITKITKNGTFDDCLFFSNSEYSMGDVVSVYKITLKNDEVINESELYSDEIIKHISSVLDCDEDDAEKMLDGSVQAQDVTGDCEDSWFIQAQQGACAVSMGYKSCKSIDEQGDVWIVPMFGREGDLVEVL